MAALTGEVKGSGDYLVVVAVLGCLLPSSAWVFLHDSARVEVRGRVLLCGTLMIVQGCKRVPPFDCGGFEG